ncbi:MAG TPA: hypothetical protein PKO16_06695 [Bacteroidia bacterium]|nr:hypothetical protein [Cyclobacteriaceae bacterium]HNO71440.1 hypothetical protein [Bacteroidia bacterium]
MRFDTIAIIKLSIALLLFACLFELPYGYYQLVRLLTTIGFSYFAILAYRSNSSSEFIIYLGIAILFQPFLKIALGKEIWNFVDVVLGVGLIASIFRKK